MSILIGRVYGRLTVLSLHHRDGRSRKFLLCKCSCGNEKVVQQTLLIAKNTKSCGCLAKDNGRLRRLPAQAGVINQIILQYKRHARDRGIDFCLSRDEVDDLVRKPCHYCGVVGGNLKKTKNLREGFPHNGIDRADSSQPYVSSNIVPCCGLCNRAKGSMSCDEFIACCRRVADHQKAMADQWSNPCAASHTAGVR